MRRIGSRPNESLRTATVVVPMSLACLSLRTTHSTKSSAWRLWSSASPSLVECRRKRRSSSSSLVVKFVTSLGNRVLERRRHKPRKAPLPTSAPAKSTVMVLGLPTVSDPQITGGKSASADMEEKEGCLYRIGAAMLYINLLRTST